MESITSQLSHEMVGGVTRDESVARAQQVKILQKMTGCSTWQLHVKNKTVCCSSDIFAIHPGEKEDRTFTLRQFVARLHPQSRKDFLHKMKELKGKIKSEMSFEIRIRTDNGTYRWFELRGTADINSDGSTNFLAGIALDISERKKLETQKDEDSSKDDLPELINKRRVTDLFQKKIGSAKNSDPFSLLVVDLDHFKQVNDEYGDVIGNQVLQHFIDTCSDVLRFNDQIGRISGEEFVIILPSANVDSSNEIASRICASFESSPYKVGDIEIASTVSIGGVTSDNFTVSHQQICAMADDALRITKKARRNNVVHCGLISVESNATH